MAKDGIGDEGYIEAMIVRGSERLLQPHSIPPAVRLAIMVLVNHVEPGWENSVAVVKEWLKRS